MAAQLIWAGLAVIFETFVKITVHTWQYSESVDAQAEDIVHAAS